MDIDIIDAILTGDIVLVKRLLQQGIELNKGYEDNITPLHYAAQNNAIEIIPLLLDAGANVDSKTKDGKTGIDLATLHEHNEAVKLLRTYEDKK